MSGIHKLLSYSEVDALLVREGMMISESENLPEFPWDILWIGGFCYLIDTNQRKIATLYGSQKQREAVAEAMICAFGKRSEQ